MLFSMNIYAQIAFAVMVLAMALSYFYAKKRQRDIRLACNQFAFAFAKISNHASPKGAINPFVLKKSDDLDSTILPIAQQSVQLKKICERVKDERIDEWYDEVQKALLQIVRLCGKNPTLCRQFRDPMQQLFDILRGFLLSCENADSALTQQSEEYFNQFLCEQLSHRKVLLKRISWDASNEYADLNARYDLTQQPQTHCCAQAATPDSSDAIPKPCVYEQDRQIETEPQDDETDSQEQLPPESPLREQWRGWGCS